MKSITVKDLKDNLGRWIIIKEKDYPENVLIGKLSTAREFEFQHTSGVYATIGGTEFEFSYSEDWAELFVTASNILDLDTL